MLCLMSACGVSRRTVEGGGSDLTHSKRTFVDHYSRMDRPAEVQAGGSLSFRAGGDVVRVPIRWSLVRDHSLVLSVRPLSFVEAARVDVTEEAVLVQDRMNRRYFRAELTPRGLRAVALAAGVSPVVLKAIAQNDPFTRDEVGKEVLNKLAMHKEAGRYVFENKREGVRHEYDRDLHLVRSVLDAGDGYSAEVLYSSFLPSGMPERVEINVGTDNRVYRVVVRLNSVSDAVQARPDTTPTEGYRPVTIKELLEILKSL